MLSPRGSWGEDADEFRPERWESGPPHPYAYAPFSHGPRACIGKVTRGARSPSQMPERP